jgi:hypothetical protein
MPEVGAWIKDDTTLQNIPNGYEVHQAVQCREVRQVWVASRIQGWLFNKVNMPHSHHTSEHR